MTDDEGSPTTPDDLVPDLFREGLKEIVRVHKLNKKGIKLKLGISYENYNGIIESKPRQSIKGAITAYQFARRNFPEIDLAPPAMPVETRELYRWLRLGQMLSAGEPRLFGIVTEFVSKAMDTVSMSGFSISADDCEKLAERLELANKGLRLAAEENAIASRELMLLDPSMSDDDATD